MKFYFAPLEGVAGHVYRKAHHTYFGGVDSYYAPFIVADQKVGFKTRDKADILPENNQGLVLIPQVLAGKAADFNHTVRKIKAFGYDEINLNLGCPSGTVVSKKKGSGFLSVPDELDRFFEEIFREPEVAISVKTRLGIEDPNEIDHLMTIFNRYPIRELTIHPRTQKEQYRGIPHRDVFKRAYAISQNPVCYNGDIHTCSAYQELVGEFPELQAVMMGRGLLKNPGLATYIQTGELPSKEAYRNFHQEIFEVYRKTIPGDRNVLFKIKEIWIYLHHAFESPEKHGKKIKKAQTLIDFDQAVNSLFREREIAPPE